MTDMRKEIVGVVSIIVIFLVTIYMAPSAIESFAIVNTDNWSVMEIAMWGLVGLSFIIGLALKFLGKI